MNRRFFNLTARGYDFITRQEVWCDQIEKTLTFIDRPDSIGRIIDLGCGPGISSFVLAERLPHASVVGIDVSDQMIHRARGHHKRRFRHLDNLEFQRCNIYKLPFEEESFDLAVGHSFLYLLPDRIGALTTIQKLLSHGGRLVLMEPNADGGLIEAVQSAPIDSVLTTPVSTTRFAISMVLWRLVSGRRGRLTPHQLEKLFTDAALDEVLVQPTLHGLGLHATGCRRSNSNCHL